MASLFEAYKKRLSISESVYARSHDGAKMDNQRKLTIATVLRNTSNFLNEAFDNSTGTQRADMGDYKRFCLNLTTVALPNLIANDLVIVHPMTSMYGSVAYIKYVAGTTKGETAQGDLFNDPFRLGNVDANYTSSSVVETAAYADLDSSTHKVATLMWTPVAKVAKVQKFSANAWTDLVLTTDYTVDEEAGTVTLTTALSDGEKIKIAYMYDNQVIPQNDLPVINAKMEHIALEAKARRIAIYYSQLAAYQAKTDYGFDLGDALAEQAVGRLSYEIDTDVTNMLIENAAEPADGSLVWSKTLPVGVSKQEHYQGFTEIVEIARQKIYDATRRFAPNYMLIASNILPILTFIPGFTAAPAGQVNGPYFCGTLNGLKVYVTPNIEAGYFVVGCNGDDLMSSAAVYAPYMAVVPTQLLQYADGGTSTGWSTMYDLKMLNASLLVKGQIVA